MDGKFFVGRTAELAQLSGLASQLGGQLVLVYGRRRIGKSYLLQHFVRGRHAVFFQASQQAEPVELSTFSEQARSVAERAGLAVLPPGVSYPTWESALNALSGTSERLIVVLDEFPYLCSTNPVLPSLLQRWWDTGGKRTNVMLILCGSSQMMMERLQAYRSPLFHRFTGRLHVRPLSYREAAAFTPGATVVDKATIFGILGGTPYNLAQWDAAQTVRQNLLRLFADPTSSLVDSAEYVLTSDLPDPTVAYRVLQAIASGKTRFAEIRDYTKVHERALPRLVDLELVERRIPATEDPAHSKRSIYVIPDPYFRFYFTFIARNRGAIERGLGGSVVTSAIVPRLNDYMGFAFEEIARSFVLDEMRRGRFEGTGVGSWWSSDGAHEIDIVGTTGTSPTLVGTVKWRSAQLDDRALRNLENHAAALGVDTSVPRLLVGRGGVDARVAKQPGIHGYSLDDLYRA